MRKILSNSKVCGLLFMAFVGLYSIMLFWSAASLNSVIENKQMFDVRIVPYTVDQAQAYVHWLGEAGRDRYLNYQIPIDMIFPVVFALFLISFVLYLTDRYHFSTWPKRLVILNSILFVPFDFWENLTVKSILVNSSLITNDLLRSLAYITCLKYFFVTVAIISTLVAIKFSLTRRAGQV